MAVTKIKPVKSTLSKALDYIENPDKTDGKMLISSFGCSYETADIEFGYLYPNAKLLVTSRKDFEPGNRKTFCSRIATGDYDAIIIGHSQFEKIPLSAERQERLIQEQMDEIEEAIEEAKEQAGEHFTVKQLEKLRKTLKQKLEKLQAAERKDDVVTFEQLGVDRLFVDESQAFKNRAKRCA